MRRKALLVIVLLALAAGAGSPSASEDEERAACRAATAKKYGDWVLKECIAACDTGCWYGYASNRNSKKFEWFFIGYDTYSKCIGAAKSELDGSESYREPFGCAYTSTSLLRTFTMNKLWGPKELVCIAKAPNELSYSPTFELPTKKEEAQGTHCVIDLPHKAVKIAEKQARAAEVEAVDRKIGCHLGEASMSPDGKISDPFLGEILSSDQELEKWPFKYPPCIDTSTAGYTDVPPAVPPRMQ